MGGPASCSKLPWGRAGLCPAVVVFKESRGSGLQGRSDWTWGLTCRGPGKQGCGAVCLLFLLLSALTQAVGVGGWLSWDEMGLVLCLLNDGVESLEFHGSWVLALLSPGY